MFLEAQEKEPETLPQCVGFERENMISFAFPFSPRFFQQQKLTKATLQHIMRC